MDKPDRRMNLPKIPVWCLPWAARKRMAEMQAYIDADRKEKLALVEEVVAEKAAHAQTMQRKLAVEMIEAKNKHAIGALVRWIYAAHGIDQRGLADILKEFPNK